MTVGVIGDTHLPFEHERYIKFIYDAFKAYGVDKIVHIGDLVDNHAISYHESDPDGLSSGDEGRAVEKKLKKWFYAFPELSIVMGNHDKLPERQAKTHGLAKRFIKSFRDVWNLPEKWEVYPDYLIIDGVYYCHGTGSSGKNAAFNLMLAKGQSVVMGHVHSFGGVQWKADHKGKYFGLNVGCGIDVEKYAFEYAKDYKWKPTLGCGIVMDGKQALFIPMDFPKYSKRRLK
jgi:predicted phosphodiesterase